MIAPIRYPEGVPPDDYMSPEEMAYYDQPLWKLLGIPEPTYLPDELAPPIDKELLRAFVRQEVTPEERDTVIRLMTMFRCWLKACAEALDTLPQPRPPLQDEFTRPP